SGRERRALALEHAGEVVPGSGRVVAPRRLGHMLSVRLEPELARALRTLARQRGVSVGALLREAAVRLADAEPAVAGWRVASVPTSWPHPRAAAPREGE